MTGDGFFERVGMTPDGEPKPEIPHNALSDAIALMRWHQKAEKAKEAK